MELHLMLQNFVTIPRLWAVVLNDDLVVNQWQQNCWIFTPIIIIIHVLYIILILYLHNATHTLIMMVHCWLEKVSISSELTFDCVNFIKRAGFELKSSYQNDLINLFYENHCNRVKIINVLKIL